ncbi:MAG: Fe-S cluster assembly protein SufD [Proteobacteria bacterium]|jgi:Fe-S cluster assembly protein SufD|nr:Fe-S cluster assembly protein SufD [Pseudomonadota bacterium]
MMTHTSVQDKFRKRAQLYFDLHGFPTRKQEDYKYTSVKEIQDAGFKPGTRRPKISAEDRKLVQRLKIKGALNLVFINGFYSSSATGELDLQRWKSLELGVSSRLSLKWFSPFLKARNEIKQLRQDSFEAQHRLSNPVNYLLRMKPSKETPLVNLILLGQGESTLSTPSIFIHALERSKVDILVTVVSSESSRVWQNSVIEGLLERDSHLTFVMNQTLNKQSFLVGKERFSVKKGAKLHVLSLAQGAKIHRQNLDVHLIEESATAVVDGVTVAREAQVIDHHTLIDHLKSYGNTSQLYKGVLADKARSVFDGLVKMRAGIEKASSEQLNNNLLLSEEAEADSKPQLMIYADDVKATHGTTVGQMNDDEMFYLMSRGIPKTEAQQMLALGYVAELVEKLPSKTLQSFLMGHLVSSLKELGLK